MTRKILVSYDLIQPGQNYTRLIQGLERAGATKVLYSAFVVKTNWTAAQVRDWAMKLIDRNDKVLVTEVSDWASYNTPRVDQI